MIAALLLEPFALWLAVRQVGAALPVVVAEGGRVLHANTLALAGGVQVGMRVSGALSRVPDLHVQAHSGPALQAGWAGVAQELLAYSPRVELLGVGRALLTLTEQAGAELAAALHARVGLADTRELALLAALSAQTGEIPSGQETQAGQVVRVHPGEDADFRAGVPLSVLRGVGLSEASLLRLGWLGLRYMGELLRWSRAQQAAFLGPEFAALRPYLHGVKSGGVSPAAQEPEVSAKLSFDEPLYEPRDLGAAARELAGSLLPALAGRKPERVTVRSQVAGLTLSATRQVKEDVRDAVQLSRAILHALHDSQAAQYGVGALEVTLGGLTRVAVHDDLWGHAQARNAAQQAEQRYPGALRRVQWLDVFSLAPTDTYQWIGLSSGQPIQAAPTEPDLSPAQISAQTPAQTPEQRLEVAAKHLHKQLALVSALDT